MSTELPAEDSSGTPDSDDESSELLQALQWGPIHADWSWSGAEDLRKYLLYSASHHAHIALENFTDDDIEMATAGMHAGIAIEHLAKAYLASIHPALLVGKNCDTDSLLHLVGKSELTKTSPYTIKTIGAVEACVRVRHLLPDFRFNENTDGLLFIVRNSVAHLGIVNDVRKALRIMVRLADPILDGLKYDRTQFWGHRQGVVDSLRNETMSEAEAILHIKYETARIKLDAKIRGFTPAEQATFKAMLSKGSHPRSDHEETHTCPVCGSQGWLICSREYDIVEYGPEPDNYDILFTEPYAYPFSFVCNACELELDDTELQAAGMPGEIELPESEIGRIM